MGWVLWVEEVMAELRCRYWTLGTGWSDALTILHLQVRREIYRCVLDDLMIWMQIIYKLCGCLCLTIAQ